MSREFTNNSANYIQGTSEAFGGFPFTASMWAILDTKSGSNKYLWCYGADGTTRHFAILHLQSTDQLIASARAVSYYSSPISLSSVSAGQPFHALAVFRSDSSRTIYLNGTAGTEDTNTAITAVNYSDTFGVQYSSGSYSTPWDGQIWEYGRWGVELTQAEITALARGVSPLMVRPGSLQAYRPFHGYASPEIDLIENNSATITGTVAKGSTHKIIYPSAQILQFPPVAAAGGGTLEAAAGSLTFTGTAATLEHNRVLDAAVGSVSFTGVDATLVYTPVSSYELTADAGALSFTGTAAGLEYNRIIDAGAGTLSLTGTAATLTYTPVGSYELTADAGAFTFTGTAAAFEYNQALDAGAGALSLSGTDAILTHNTAGSYTLAASPGVLSITGTAAALQYSRVLEAAAGSITFAGTDATLAAGLGLTASPGSLTFTGSAVTIQYDRILAAEAGSLTFTGTAATLAKAGIGTAESTTEHSITLLDASHPVTILDASHTGLI